jgi:hypothetical protein
MSCYHTNSLPPFFPELTIDLACSATRDAWETLSEVVQEYKESAKFTVRVLPLPYHQYAFLMSKAASTVYYYLGDREAFNFMNTAILNQPEIYNSATADKSYNDIKHLVKGWATNSTALSDVQFEEGFDVSTAPGNTIEMFTRYEFKFAAIEGTYGTPMYRINGLLMDPNGLATIEDWRATLDPLTKTPRQISANPSTIYL